MSETLEDPLGVLRRVLRPRERAAPGEQCDMCAEPVGEQHSHVANIGDRRLMCTCRGCYLLFTSPGAGGLRMRAVPEDYRRVEKLAFTQQQWDDLAVPVDLVFVFRQTDVGDDSTSVTAWYPSPAGAAESEVDPQAWDAVVADNPELAGLADDVQALLLRRIGPGEFVSLIVPIDACYELTGLVRTHWSGFSGGTEMWAHIDAFFDGACARAERTPRGSGA